LDSDLDLPGLTDDQRVFIQWMINQVDARADDIFFRYEQQGEREKIIERIFNAPAYPGPSKLGCPLSNDSLTALCNQIRALTLDTFTSFDDYKYDQVNTNLMGLKAIKESFPVPEMVELCDHCFNEIESKTRNLQASATTHFDQDDFPRLRVDLVRLRLACRTITHFQLEEDFQERVRRLNERIEALGQETLSGSAVNRKSLSLSYDEAVFDTPP
jgi:hypothetical protein